jgi:hypothetical protein
LKSVVIGKEATITKGKHAGTTGIIVGANNITRKITIETNQGTCIVANWDNVEQK